MANTPDQDAAEISGRAIDGKLAAIDDELARLANAATRIAELQAFRTALLRDKAAVDPRRPLRASGSVPVPTI